MNRIGLIILLGSLVGAGLLIVLWIIGLLFNLAGSLIHLLLVLALPIGAIGTVVGLVLLVAGKKQKET